MSVLAQGRLSNVVPGVPGTAGLIPGPGLVWAALFVNVLAFSGLPTVIPIPGSVGQLVTQGSLILAVVLALLANPRAVVRPTLFLVLLTMLAIVSLMVSIHNQFMLGSTFRAVRLIEFVVVLWLLTPWWGRPEFDLLKTHLTCLRVVTATVLIGAMLSPGPRSPTVGGCPARSGRFRRPRSPTTRRSCSAVRSCSGSAAWSAAAPRSSPWSPVVPPWSEPTPGLPCWDSASGSRWPGRACSSAMPGSAGRRA